MSEKKFCNIETAIKIFKKKGYSDKDLSQAMLNGEINPLIRDKTTGLLKRVRVKGINEETGELIIEEFDDFVLG